MFFPWLHKIGLKYHESVWIYFFLPTCLPQTARRVRGQLVLSNSGTLWSILNKELELGTFGEGSGRTGVIMHHRRLSGGVWATNLFKRVSGIYIFHAAPTMPRCTCGRTCVGPFFSFPGLAHLSQFWMKSAHTSAHSGAGAQGADGIAPTPVHLRC